jgi:host factor-I protein
LQKQTNIQDLILNTARRERIPVTVYLVNGFQIRGLIKGFDNFVVLLEGEGRQQLVYKHALSTISPSREIPIRLNCAEKEEPCPTENA